MEKIRLTGRSSALSLLQISIVKAKIEKHFPNIQIEVIAKNSRGDTLQNIPLHTVEGTDFFTQEIFDTLANEEADIAVHSLKDMSSEHFFGDNFFTIIDRDDVRDIAIFNNDIEEKLKTGKSVIIGTCSPRREEMAMNFLKKALPQLNEETKIQVKPIRGNVETRLKKLDNGEYDGTILAAAGLNRLLTSVETPSAAENPDGGSVSYLLKNKKLMLLPLFECVPAPCQGAIVAEAHHTNKKAISILQTINEKEIFDDCAKEKKTAAKFGKGCLQKFGVTTVYYGNQKTIYASGRDENGNEFQYWDKLPELYIEGKRFFSSSDYMKGFFDYEFLELKQTIEEAVVYVANYKSIKNGQLTDQLKSKKVWAAGTKTWYELAKKGIWVEGCADALGLETLPQVWKMPLLQINKKDVRLVTNETAAVNWQKKGWKILSTHKLINRNEKSIENEIKNADVIFWTSAGQYEQLKKIVKKDAIHACPYGETTELLKAAGLSPVVFPTIKSFIQWRNYSIR